MNFLLLMETKFNAYNKTLYEFINNIFVVCPNCGKQAIVVTKGFLQEKNETEIRLVCAGCGTNKYYSEMPKDNWVSEKSGIRYSSRILILAGTVDPYFRLPLWLQKEMPDGVLWAYNYEHLNFLEEHVGAILRVRDVSLNHNRSLGSRLPKWMTSKKNRGAVLEAIQKLKQK